MNVALSHRSSGSKWPCKRFTGIEIYRLIQFAKNIFHCKDTQTIFQRKIFSQHTIAKKNYVLGVETIYAEYLMNQI